MAFVYLTWGDPEMQCYAPSKLSWYTPFGRNSSKFMWKNTKRSLMNSMNSESSATCDIRHPGIHMAWVGCGLALNVAELQAMQGMMLACYASSKLLITSHATIISVLRFSGKVKFQFWVRPVLPLLHFILETLMNLRWSVGTCHRWVL